jgi:aspartate oxidase
LILKDARGNMGQNPVARNSLMNGVLVPRPTSQTIEVPDSPDPKSFIKQNTKDRWLDMYPHIERLYIRERRKLRHVMSYMEREHHFIASYVALDNPLHVTEWPPFRLPVFLPFS